MNNSLFWLLLIALGAPAADALSQETTAAPFLFENANSGTSSPLRIVAVGDVLLHGPLHKQALVDPMGHRSLWQAVEPWLLEADMAYANLEGPVADGIAKGGRPAKDPGRIFDNHVYSSYPMFNYQRFLLSDLKASGFDVVSTANNHALDRGSIGADRTIENLQAENLPFTGTRPGAASGKEAWHTLVQANGWRIAWIACSFSTNGIPDPKKQVLHCYKDRSVVLGEVRLLANDPTVDAVIVTPHWGNEYQDKPQAAERLLAREMIEAGAIAVLGAHPHVPQPWEKHLTHDGREGLIVYSMGNFVSGQFHRLYTRASVLISIDLAKNQIGRPVIVGAGYLPLEMTRTSKGYQLKVIDKDDASPIGSHLEKMFGSP